MDKNKNQETIHPLEQFLIDVKEIPANSLEDSEYADRLGDLASQLVLASMESDTENLDQITTDRNTRKNIRTITPLALNFIHSESGGDTELELELRRNLVTSLGKAGVLADTIKELAEESSSEKTKPSADTPDSDFIPKVKASDKEYLENLVSVVKTSGKWSNKTTEDAASGFLDIYYVAEQKIRSGKGNHQEILNAIATCGTYSHAIASALSHLPSLEQTSRIDDMKSELMKQLRLRADGARLQQLSQYDEYTANEIPEIKEFSSAIKGAQYELLSHNAIDTHKDKLAIEKVEYSTLEDDISKGFDIVIERNEKKYYVDIKASRSFKRSRDKYPQQTIISDNQSDGFVVRTTSHKDENNEPITIIVIDAESTGSIKYHRNRLQLQTPEKYLRRLLEGMSIVDNYNK